MDPGIKITELIGYEDHVGLVVVYFTIIGRPSSFAAISMAVDV